jgi:hypothetical protein
VRVKQVVDEDEDDEDGYEKASTLSRGQLTCSFVCAHTGEKEEWRLEADCDSQR